MKLRGVAAVYQRHSYAEERQRALEAWGARLVSDRSAPNAVNGRIKLLKAV